MNQWIAVTEELPSSQVWVLVWSATKKCIYIGRYEPKTRFAAIENGEVAEFKVCFRPLNNCDCCNQPIEDVSHWMPLPEQTNEKI